jgi:YebC/PmpR family DNA-binding regulatory protein
MSGHSKWSSIKHQKAATDAKRGAIFTKLTREIIVAARKGGPNPEANYALRLAIQRAKDSSMPWDNISRAIDKASGAGDGVQLQEITYEGYGPGGAAILVMTLSDNKNRTVQNIRNVFERSGGSLGESGCVGWLFDQKGVISVKAEDIDPDELMMKAIDAGADDVNVDKEDVTIYTTPKVLEDVRTALEKEKIPVESAEVSMVPKTMLDLEDKQAIQNIKLMERLEELDEVQKVASNVNFSDSAISSYQAETK